MIIDYYRQHYLEFYWWSKHMLNHTDKGTLQHTLHNILYNPLIKITSGSKLLAEKPVVLLRIEIL